MLGGLLTEVSWHWVMFINVPIGLAVLLLGPRLLPEPRRHPARLDLIGAITSTIGIAALVYGLIRGASDGWVSAPTIALLAIGAGAFTAFLVVESRTSRPLVPMWLFTQRNRAGSYLNMLLIPAAMFAVFFFLTQFTQSVLGFSPLRAGLAFLPLAVAQYLAARTAPALLPRFGPKPVTVTGAGLIAAGSAWLTQVSSSTGYATGLLGPLLLFGLGVGLCFMPLNMMIVSGLPPEDTGIASGVLQAMQQVGGSVGLAVLVTVFAAFSDPQAGRSASASGTPAAGDEILVHGIAAAFTAGTVLAAVAVVVALFALRHGREA